MHKIRFSHKSRNSHHRHSFSSPFIHQYLWYTIPYLGYMSSTLCATDITNMLLMPQNSVVGLIPFFMSFPPQEWKYYLNGGSEVNISYRLSSGSSSIFLVIAEGMLCRKDFGDFYFWFCEFLSHGTTAHASIVYHHCWESTIAPAQFEYFWSTSLLLKNFHQNPLVIGKCDIELTKWMKSDAWVDKLSLRLTIIQ